MPEAPGHPQGGIDAEEPGTREGDGKARATEQRHEFEAALIDEETLIDVRREQGNEHVAGQCQADQRRGEADDQQDPADRLRDSHERRHEAGRRDVERREELLGVQRPPWRLAPAAVVWESTSHAVFGTALEAMRRVLRG